MSKILDANPIYDPEFEGNKKYLMEVRAAIEELRASHGLDSICNSMKGKIIMENKFGSEEEEFYSSEIFFAKGGNARITGGLGLFCSLIWSFPSPDT